MNFSKALLCGDGKSTSLEEVSVQPQLLKVYTGDQICDIKNLIPSSLDNLLYIFVFKVLKDCSFIFWNLSIHSTKFLYHKRNACTIYVYLFSPAAMMMAPKPKAYFIHLTLNQTASISSRTDGTI